MIRVHSISNKSQAKPEALLNDCVDGFAAGTDDNAVFALDYTLQQDYLPDAPELGLFALVALEKSAKGVRVALTITPKTESLLQSVDALQVGSAAARRWAEHQGLAWLELDKPLRLQPVYIPKPWGREIWYTGIEARGQSSVMDESGRAIPLPWLLSLCPQRLLAGDGRQPVLLKILDPLPDPVLGDLYFEMHEEKREVYVVTHVDRAAWPDGTGGIRFGFNQQKRAASPSDEAFKDDYLAAVNAYRAVRVQIDEQLDRYRKENDIAPDAPVPPETLRQWLVGIPTTLREREAELRAAMDAFVHVDPLGVGDVVKVPCYTPHSLLHGVRTVEFQTPVYERKILSFAQKVLTQPHWDTATAMDQVSLEPPAKIELPVMAADDGFQLEEVAVFEDFRVERLTLKAGRSCTLGKGDAYCLLMAVSGQLSVNERRLGAEEAALVP
ncbi:MAG: hypothetical protein WDZ30_06800, partial [Cellvibrionaceae bacterium]